MKAHARVVEAPRQGNGSLLRCHSEGLAAVRAAAAAATHIHSKVNFTFLCVR